MAAKDPEENAFFFLALQGANPFDCLISHFAVQSTVVPEVMCDVKKGTKTENFF